MSRSTQMKAALVTLLVTTALVGNRLMPPVYRPMAEPGLIGLLVFAVVNVLWSPPGTFGVRAAAIGATFAALLWPDKLVGLVALLAWLVWPPAFMVSWALAREANTTANNERPDGKADAIRARMTMAGLIAAVAVASLAYRALAFGGLQQTAALFIGIPTILAIVVVLATSPRSAIGVACKAVTVGLLMSLLFLREGILCVAMSAPLFYAVAIVIAAVMDRARHRRDGLTTVSSFVVLLATIPMSLEGVTNITTLNRDESVTETTIVRASSQAVAQAIFLPPRFDRVLPLYLRAGFPRAVTTRIDQGSDETRWVIQLRGGEMRLNGMEPRTGDLVLTLEETRPGLVRWRAVTDSSHMTHFLTWRDAVVQWEPVDAETTKVTWTLRYRRDLDPAWYFGPWERYAVRLAARYLIDSVATP